MAKASGRNRIVLQLDPRIALEALILNRIERVPKARQQEWLRGLLVQGFQVECQVCREVSDITETRGRLVFSDWLTGDPTRQSILPKVGRLQKQKVLTETKEKSNTVKPFAQLGKVIG